MNKPFKPVVEQVLADACVGISMLKANPAAVIAEAQERPVAVLNRNKPVADNRPVPVRNERERQIPSSRSKSRRTGPSTCWSGFR